MESQVVVELSWGELLIAGQVGLMRQVSAVTKKRKADDSKYNNGWESNFIGAVGEFSVAKYLDLFWDGNMGKLHMADVANIEVKTNRREDGDLILQKTNDPKAIYVLVTGSEDKYTIHGWQKGSVIMKPAYWMEPKSGWAAYFYPQDKLKPIEELKIMIGECKSV